MNMNWLYPEYRFGIGIGALVLFGLIFGISAMESVLMAWIPALIILAIIGIWMLTPLMCSTAFRPEYNKRDDIKREMR